MNLTTTSPLHSLSPRRFSKASAIYTAVSTPMIHSRVLKIDHAVSTGLDSLFEIEFSPPALIPQAHEEFGIIRWKVAKTEMPYLIAVTVSCECWVRYDAS